MQDQFDRAAGCCFTGHRPNALPALGKENTDEMQHLVYLLDRALNAAIDDGITDFYAGGAKGFDTLAAESVLRMRELNPGIRLYLALPGHDQSEGWNQKDRVRYETILENACKVWYAADICSPESMKRRNRYLVDHTGRCIAYLRRMRGGTLYTVNYALDQKIPVDNLAEHMLD